MKKILTILLIIFTLSLCACKNKKENDDLKIICPTGAPSIAFYNYINNNNFETNSVPKNIVSFMTDNSDYDIVVIDTVSGIKAINNGAKYKLASTITFGNFFIASTGNDTDNEMNEDDKIVLFGKNQTPDLLFHYIYGNKFNECIEYVNAVSDAQACLASGKNMETGSDIDYVFIAQPALFACLNNKDAKTYGKSKVYQNIQELYDEKSNGLSLIQASVFVKDGINKKIVDNFLEKISKDISKLISTPEILDMAFESTSEEKVMLKFGVKAAPIKACIKNNNTLGIGYKSSYAIKDSIDEFIKIFNMGETSEEIYYF